MPSGEGQTDRRDAVRHPGARRTWAAWGVHAFTSCGAVAGLFAAVAVMQERWVLCFAWLGVALAIDGVDGRLARLARVSEVLPGFDGALLDNLVDYFTYVVVPALFLWRADLLPPRLAPVGAALVVLTSAYQFCQVDAKTADHYFKGWPSYWNVLALYLFLLGWNPWVNFGLLAL